ncbi:hypothetical protein HY634_00830 [Candidatus Uhrbacteria bacterium]|nr:hypothetical protein [Candidatus Uhrbacteria bacterium]
MSITNFEEFLTAMREVRGGMWYILPWQGSRYSLWWDAGDKQRCVTPITAVYDALRGTTHHALTAWNELPLAHELGLPQDLAIKIMEAAEGVVRGPSFFCEPQRSIRYRRWVDERAMRARILEAVGVTDSTLEHEIHP